MKIFKALLGTAAVILALAVNINANAQVIQVNAIGSSALFLELGQAAASSFVGATCAWTAGSGKVSAVDSRFGTAPGTTENGAFWVTWTPTSGNCATVNGTTNIYSFISTDSTVGNRCFFASPRCTLVFPVSNVGTAGALQLPGVTDVTLPAGIQSALNGQPFNSAGTDIRPEDAKFATIRALAPCGSPVATGSQYLGLGYASGTTGVGNPVKSFYSSAQFNVADFNLTGNDPITNQVLPGTFTVSDVGAVPIVVTVNPSNSSGFGNLLVQNINRGVLAGYLDGTYGRTSDLTVVPYSSASPVATTVFVREPLSGTYNTMEYAIPNNLELQSSQDVGLAAVNAFNTGSNPPNLNCTSIGGTVAVNPLHDTFNRVSGTSQRNRVIGTGQMVAEIALVPDSLGYAFWSTGNFKGFNGNNGKYLTVDGIDPIQETWNNGLIPTSSNGLLGNVTFTHVKDGSYPIWSKLRMVSQSSAGVAALVAAAQNFISPTQPDFVPVAQLNVLHSHFAPPGVSFPSTGGNQPSNGGSCGSAEVGGDVGGVIYTTQADGDFCADSASTFGRTGKRQ